MLQLPGQIVLQSAHESPEAGSLAGHAWMPEKLLSKRCQLCKTRAQAYGPVSCRKRPASWRSTSKTPRHQTDTTPCRSSQTTQFAAVCCFVLVQRAATLSSLLRSASLRKARVTHLQGTPPH